MYGCKSRKTSCHFHYTYILVHTAIYWKSRCSLFRDKNLCNDAFHTLRPSSRSSWLHITFIWIFVYNMLYDNTVGTSVTRSFWNWNTTSLMRTGVLCSRFTRSVYFTFFWLNVNNWPLDNFQLPYLTLQYLYITWMAKNTHIRRCISIVSSTICRMYTAVQVAGFPLIILHNDCLPKKFIQSVIIKRMMYVGR